jgi:murein endopeptidase
MNFGTAIEALKEGKRVSRQGWNGKGMFLFLLPASDGIPTSVIHDPALKKVIEAEVGGDSFDALGSIRMFTADKKILTGWLASQSDMLAEDWVIL